MYIKKKLDLINHKSEQKSIKAISYKDPQEIKSDPLLSDWKFKYELV